MSDEPKLEWYTVVSKEIGRPYAPLIYSNVLAVSVKDALRFERGRFGEPHFRVLRGYKKHEAPKDIRSLPQSPPRES
jgi:hypothetical protein